MSLSTKALIVLIALCLVDIFIPIPILGAVLIYVVLQKPTWFSDLVRDIYGRY